MNSALPKPVWPESKPPHQRRWKHGFSRTKIYRLWKDIRRRCENPKRRRYNRYGGRGIKVCELWITSFRAFWEWAMSHGYQEGLQIDRIDNDGHYCPENCRFVTAIENNRNRPQFKRTDALVLDVAVLLSETQNISEVARLSGVSRQTVRRIAKELGKYEAIAKLGKARYNFGR